MSDCCVSPVAWAKQIVDGLPAGTPVPQCSSAQLNSWARTILDSLPSGCDHVSHGTTALELVYAIGAKPLVAKTAVAAIDCGRIDFGSLVFSTTKSGAVAAVIGQTCNEYMLVIISQPGDTISEAAKTAINNLTLATSSDSLGALKLKYNELVAAIKLLV